jgi:hypothetical protein
MRLQVLALACSPQFRDLLLAAGQKVAGVEFQFFESRDAATHHILTRELDEIALPDLVFLDFDRDEHSGSDSIMSWLRNSGPVNQLPLLVFFESVTPREIYSPDSSAPTFYLTNPENLERTQALLESLVDCFSDTARCFTPLRQLPEYVRLHPHDKGCNDPLDDVRGYYRKTGYVREFKRHRRVRRKH